MKKFVLMETINKVFDGIDFIDYVTVANVTDSMVELDIHLLNYKIPSPGSKEVVVLNDCCLVLGKMLDRKIKTNLIPSKISRALFSRLMAYCKKLP